jgi:hypothetical protein
MTRPNSSLHELTSQEYRRFILPTALAGALVFLTLLVNAWIDSDIPLQEKYTITFLVVASTIYVTTYGFYLIPTHKYKDVLIWANAIFSGVGLGLYAILLPENFIAYLNPLLFLSVISISTFSGRLPTLLTIAIASTANLTYNFETINSFIDWAGCVGMPAISILMCEMIVRIQNISREQIHRLEIINSFSRQVAAARDRQQVFEHLNSAIPNALVADSYYVSAIENDEVHLIICYDDGEYFNDVRAPAEGTLTNWVVQNQRELFLPDLRQPINLAGIKIILVGKDKTSLSWIGVPFHGSAYQ